MTHIQRPFDGTSLNELIDWGADYLAESDLSYGHGTDNPVDEAAWIVLHAIGGSPVATDINYSATLTKAQIKAAKLLLEKRVNTRLPTAYLTQKAWFAGLEFYIDERVLVPRSPLAELILDLFSSLLDPNGVNRILDMCTGSGCIAIASAYVFADAKIDAVDLSQDALDVAEINVDKHCVKDQVSLIQSDVFSKVPPTKYDLILSNPPYVDKQEMQNLSAEFVHEPALGLAAGSDGLDIIVKILQRAGQFLSDNGVLIAEVGNSAEALSLRFPTVPFQWIEFETGGDGVFMLSAQDLQDYEAVFSSV